MQPGAGSTTAGAAVDGVEIRHMRTRDEMEACVALQSLTWGEGFREPVPATILKITQRLGGITAGAFAEDGALLGFVFGITGVERGEIVHWSHMLAVHPGAQNHGIGRRLKEFQRESLRALGARRMYWTYDPLVARNAHFNINRLRAGVSEYVADMYGNDSGSPVHSGVGTDRFIVVWPITADGREAGPRESAASVAPTSWDDAPILNAGTTDGGVPDLARFTALPPAVRIEIPSDIQLVQATSTAQAAHWRATTRSAFQWALAHDYTVTRFAHGRESAHACYLLTLRPSPAAPAAP